MPTKAVHVIVRGRVQGVGFRAWTRHQAELRDLGKDAELLVYPGVDHAFFNDTRPEVYDAAAAVLAWTRTLEFLRAKLG